MSETQDNAGSLNTPAVETEKTESVGDESGKLSFGTLAPTASSPALDRATIEIGAGAEHQPYTFADFLSYLSFKGHAVRFGIELSICFFLFVALRWAFGWTDVPLEWHALHSWFLACTSIAALDHFLFLRPYLTYQKVCSLEASGKPLEALAMLETIAPSRKRLIRYPAHLYHLRRASILLHHDHFDAATYDLQLARKAGLITTEYYLAMAELSRFKKDFDGARKELQRARALTGDSAVYELENALILLDEGAGVQTVRRAFEKVLCLPDEEHPAGATTECIARAYLSLLKLTSGHAEDGLDELQRHLPFLVSMAASSETLRPLVSHLYLSRAQYYASHYSKENAEGDLRVGSLLSEIPARRSQAEKVRDEISYRFKRERS